MVVAHVVLTLHPGGQEYVVIQLAERLQRRGVRSPVIVLDGGALMSEANRRGLETFDLAKGDGLVLSVFWRLRQLLRRQQADVVHTHNFAPLIYGTVAAHLARIPTVNTRHGRAALRTHPFIWQLTDAAVAVSEDARREMLKHNRIAPAKVRVVLNGVDIHQFGRPLRTGADVRAELGLPPVAPVFGIVARLAPEKDHLTLLESFRRVLDIEVEAHLMVVGGGPLDQELRLRATRLGLGDRVRFLGFRQDVPELLGAMDVFVLSSTMEGISLTLLEAMAAGLPVVATRVGGNPEVVVHGETGLLVPPGEAVALSSAMLSIAQDRPRAASMGGAGRARAAAVFDLDRMVDAYQAIYRELCEGS